MRRRRRRSCSNAARSTSVKGLRDTAREVRAGTQADDAAWARRQHDRRYGRVWTDPEGSVRIEGSLPPETGARFKAVFDAEVDRIFREARKPAGASRTAPTAPTPSPRWRRAGPASRST